MRLKHSGEQQQPIDRRDEHMKREWVAEARRCFPLLADELAVFKFKNYANKYGRRGGNAVVDCDDR